MTKTDLEKAKKQGGSVYCEGKPAKLLTYKPDVEGNLVCVTLDGEYVVADKGDFSLAPKHDMITIPIYKNRGTGKLFWLASGDDRSHDYLEVDKIHAVYVDDSRTSLR